MPLSRPGAGGACCPALRSPELFLLGGVTELALQCWQARRARQQGWGHVGVGGVEEGDREACWSQAVALGGSRDICQCLETFDCHGLLVGLLLSSCGWQTGTLPNTLQGTG